MFHISIVLRRIRKRTAGNAITVLGILIGTSLIIFSLNIMLEIRRQNRLLLNSAMDITYTISSRNIPRQPQTHFLTESELNELNSVSDVRVSVSIKYDIITFAGRSHIENGEEIADRYTVIFSESVSEICAEREFADVLPLMNEKNTVNYGDMLFAAVSVSDTFDDKEQYVHSCIIPLRMYWEIAKPSGFSEFILTAVCDDSDGYKSILSLEEILLKSEEYDFAIGNEFYDFLSKAAYAGSALKKITFFSGIMLSVVFVSMVCVFLCLIDKRAYELAVCRAAGASAGTVFLEFFFELLIITLFPTVISIPGNFLVFANGIEFIGVSVCGLKISAAVISVIGILLTDGICIIPVALKLMRLKPYELLSVEG